MNNDDFIKEYNAIVERAFLFVKKAAGEGLLALEDLLDEERYMRRDIFEYGLTLVVDGNDYEIIDRILTNIIELEADNDKKLLKKIQKEAVLAICVGTNPRMLLMLLNSYVHINVEDTMKKYKELYKNEIDETIKKEKKENVLNILCKRFKKR